MPNYRQADLNEARQLAPDATSKAQERIAAALAARERKGAEKLVAERDLRLLRGEVQHG